MRLAGDAVSNAIEREFLERERAILTTRLERARRMQMIGSLASGIAHNFNNIIGAILGFSEMLEPQLTPGTKTAQHIDEIRRAAERGRDLIDNVLNFGRRRDARVQPVQVRTLFEEAASILRASLPSGIELIIQDVPANVAVSGEPAQLQQIILNLCTNAAQAMQGSGCIHVTVEHKDVLAVVSLSHGQLTPGHYVCLAVIDTGHGFDEDVARRLFEPFFTTRLAGTGLGLATVLEIVRDHEGAMNVQSTPGHGSRFEAWLPAATAGGAARVGPAMLPLGHGETVLVVESERERLLRDEEMLAALGYEPIGFHRPADALAACSSDSSRFDIPRLRENPKTPLAKRRDPDSTERMIRPGFLDIELRQNLIELARDGLAAHRLARRANALVLLDDGMSCEAIAKVLLLDDDTIRTWYRLYEGDGIEGLTNFSYEGSACQLSGEQQEKLKAWVATALPRTTRQVGAWIENEFGVVYEGRSGLIALLHRLGLEYHKPNVIPRKLDEEKQRAFIEGYEKLLNSLGDDEAVLFADAVHPTHAARPVGCWAPSQEKLAIEQTSGRQRINIHGAIDLETGQTRMIEALTIDAASTIRLLQSIEALYPMLALIHVFLDNARYHHAKLVQEWLALPGRRIKLHFIPTYCPHLNPIERLWGLMHRNVTHNKCYATCAQFADATLSFLREKVPGNWADLCDSVTDNFRIINPKDFRVMT